MAQTKAQRSAAAKKICGLFITTILLVAPLLGSIPAVFADDEPDLTELREECAEVEEDPKDIEPECELLNLIKDLQAKDMQLMDKDMKLMDKDMELMDNDAELEANVDKTCATIPVVKAGFGLLTSSLLVAFGTVNSGIGLINTGVVGKLNAFNLNIISFDPPSFDTGISVPGSITVGTFKLNLSSIGLGTVSFANPGDINLKFGPFVIDIPEISAPSFTPFSGIPTIPSVGTTGIAAADDAVQNLDECL